MHSPTTAVDAASLTRLAHHARLLPPPADDTHWQRNLQVVVAALDALEQGAEALPSATDAPAPSAANSTAAAGIARADGGDSSPADAAAAHQPEHGDDELARPGRPRLRLNDLRPDQVQPSLTPDQALANAPQRLGDGFGVPPVMTTSRAR